MTCSNPGQHHDTVGIASRALLLTLALALGLIVAMVWLVGGPASGEAQAMPGDASHIEQDEIEGGVIRVAISGEDTPGCGAENNPCRTVQHAAGLALPGDEIRVAAGTYTGTNSYGGLSQLVYLTKTLTIRGGYTTSNWTTPDPEANPTTLDAEGDGRVLVISDTITIHAEGLGFEGGDATGLGGGPDNEDAGGGVYIFTSTVTISNCLIFSNTGSTTGPGYGGGFYVREGSVELLHNEILSNTASYWYGFGGGMYVDRGSAVLSHNTVMSNTASYWGDGYGGGLYLEGGLIQAFPSASLVDNDLLGNYASRKADGQGGGMYAKHYDVELLDNLVQYNTGGAGLEGKGGGLYIFLSDAVLEGNLVRYNIANRGFEEGISGGVHFCTCGNVTLENNTIFSNTACIGGNGYGGGVSFCKTEATLDSNKIISNTATLSTGLTVRGWGGGVWTGDRASLSLSNDLIAGNHAKTQGSGLWFGVELDDENPLGSRLQHVTIADNSGGIGQGVYVTNTVAFLTNTIIAGHPAFGVFAPYGGEATLEATLWYDNKIDHTYGSNVEIGDLNYYDEDPAFADPEAWDYHIEPGSAALDRGVATGVRSDMDGQPRPRGAPDLGADEYWPPGTPIRTYLPLVLRQSS